MGRCVNVNTGEEFKLHDFVGESVNCPGSHNRLWQRAGSGSYRLKPEDIQFRVDKDNALITTLFIVYAPLAVAIEKLQFHVNLPRHVPAHLIGLKA